MSLSDGEGWWWVCEKEKSEASREKEEDPTNAHNNAETSLVREFPITSGKNT